MRRRQVLAAGLGAAFAAREAAAHAPVASGPKAPRGLVLPRAAPPPVPLLDLDGRRRDLADALRGRVSCVQLMFAGCTTSCPIQGAVFAALARQPLPGDVQLLSITVDPLGDGPQQLSRWLDRFGRFEFWSAAAPRPEDVEALGSFLRGVPARAGTHTTQAFLFDREARLAFRSVDMPTPEHLADLLRQLARA